MLSQRKLPISDPVIFDQLQLCLVYFHFRVVVFRKANKIGFFIKVVPQTEKEDVKVSKICIFSDD